MQTRFWFALCCLYWALSTPLCAVTPNVVALLAEVRQTREQIHTLSVNYVSSVQSTVPGQKAGQETGRLFQEGNTMRKEVLSPMPQLTIRTPTAQLTMALPTGAAQIQAITGNAESALEETVAQYGFSFAGSEGEYDILKGSYQGNEATIWIHKHMHTIDRWVITQGKISVITIDQKYEWMENIPVLTECKTVLTMSLGGQPATVSSIINYYQIQLNKPLQPGLFSFPAS